MERIRLSKEEKQVFWVAMKGEPSPPVGMEYKVYFASVFSLHQKGLVKAQFNYNKVVSVHRTQLGDAYLSLNPSLTNPIDWFRIMEIILMGVTALATTVALFVSCTLLAR